MKMSVTPDSHTTDTSYALTQKLVHYIHLIHLSTGADNGVIPFRPGCARSGHCRHGHALVSYTDFGDRAYPPDMPVKASAGKAL